MRSIERRLKLVERRTIGAFTPSVVVLCKPAEETEAEAVARYEAINGPVANPDDIILVRFIAA
ncbi:hypothetical protein [uncultured Parasphingorhabdus sp.]|uniref:hypothetical protein n=1 Tax=uncultured Parasphingorhabdus sp. TaxID=2709694 RepID=UPI0030DA7CA1|tara:strand:+ start:32862 stop:33050 length:189 start_codon:yes stop_codon:yes gene_type:complete